MAQRKSAVSWTQGTLAGLPFGIPGMELEMEGAMQQAAQWERHFIRELYIDRAVLTINPQI